MKQVDGKLRALYSMTEPNTQTVNEVIRKLNRLLEWAYYFEIPIKLEAVLEWIKDGDCTENLVLE